MQKVLLIIQAIAALLPAIRDAIKLVEEAVPQSGQGSAKLAMVKGMLQSAFEAVDEVQVTFEQIWPAINTVIDSLVAIYNSLGLFKKA